MTKTKKYPPINVTHFKNELTGKEFYTPESDIIFKCIFGRPGNEAITKAFLESILKHEVEEFTLEANPNFIKEHANAKGMIADVKAVGLESKNKYLLEMQTTAHRYLPRRFTVYSHNSHSEDLKKSDDYNLLRKVVTVVVLSKNLPQYRKIKEYHTIWSGREKRFTEYELDEDVTIHLIELQKYIKNKKKTNEVNPWLEFFINPLGEEVRKAMKNNKELESAVNELDFLNSDETVREIALFQKLAELDRRAEIQCAKEKAYEKGYEKAYEEVYEEAYEDGVETIARNMIILNLNADIIIKATGLSKEKIEELKNEKVKV